MRIAIYTPYLDTSGGGEKYMLTIAEILSEREEVDVLLDEHLSSLDIGSIRENIQKMHDLKLSKVRFVSAPIGPKSSFLNRGFFLKKYDFLFLNSDGSIPFSTAKNSIIHFQVPFPNTNARGVWGKLRQSSFKLAICNSRFTEEVIKQSWKLKTMVVYPPVPVEKFKTSDKKNQIVSVGRFRREKKQDVLIEAFKKGAGQNKFPGWSLHLAGGTNVGDVDYLNGLKKASVGFDVNFYENIKFDDLVKLYSESAIYWHAAGYGETDPKLFEHFGITTVEAMSSGCVPIVINKGGQREIITEGSGELWESSDEMIEKTALFMKDKEKMLKYSKEAILSASRFSDLEFKKNIEKIVYGKSF